MISSEEKKIAEFNEKTIGGVRIGLVAGAGERSGQFVRFCDEFASIASGVLIDRETDEEKGPEMRIGERLKYMAIPLGPELGPFLEAISAVSEKNDTSVPREIGELVEKIKSPVELRLFISQNCAFCPKAVRKLVPLAVYCEFISLSVIDGFMFPELAAADGVKSAPTLILNENFRWTGDMNLEEIVDAAANPSVLSVSAMIGIVEQGDAGRLAGMITERGSVPAEFVDLLVHEKFDVRLGAMVAAEEIAGKNAGLAEKLVKPLWEKYHDQRVEIQGDILYVLGEAGNERTIPLIKEALDETDNEDIGDVATEAMEKIKNRQREQT